MALCLVLNPIVLLDKCIFHSEVCSQFSDKFVESCLIVWEPIRSFSLRCLWISKRREVVLGLQWFREQRDLWFTSPPPWIPPPGHQPSKNLSQPPPGIFAPMMCHPLFVRRWRQRSTVLRGQISLLFFTGKRNEMHQTFVWIPCVFITCLPFWKIPEPFDGRCQSKLVLFFLIFWKKLLLVFFFRNFVETVTTNSWNWVP